MQTKLDNRAVWRSSKRAEKDSMKLEQFRLFIFIILIVFLQSCTSSMIRIESVPEKAEVSVSVLGGNKRQVLGMTPLTQVEIPAEFKGVPVTIEISHPGYLTETIIVPDVSGLNIDLRKNLTSVENATSQEKVARIEKLNRSIDLIFEAVNKAQMNNKEGALKTLAEVKNRQPDLSAAYEIEGNIYMMNGDYKSALVAYTEALKYNPDQINLIQMKARLEKTLGVTTLTPPPPSRSTAGSPAATPATNPAAAVQPADVPVNTELPPETDIPAGETQ